MRLITCGWETGSYAESAGGAITGANWAVDGTIPYEGNYCLKANTGAVAANQYMPFATGAVLGRKISVRHWFRFPAAPVALISIGTWGSGSTTGIYLSTGRTLRAYINNVAQGIPSAALAVDTWHLIEMSLTIGTGAVDAMECSVNGVSLFSASGLSISDNLYNAFYVLGLTISARNDWICYYDSLKINDDQGTSETGFPGDGALALLLPTADSAIGSGWTAGGGATSSLYAAVDNVPPVGAADPGTNASQIRNATSAASTYTATLQDYTTGGVTGTVNGVQAITVVAAAASTGAKSGTLGVASNPAGTPLSFGTFYSGANAGTFPTGWKYALGQWEDSPTVTLGTAPTVSVAITGGTASRIADSCFVGLYVDYTASSGTNATVAGSDASDVAALATAVTTGSAVAAADTQDTAALATTVTTGSAVAATDTKDTAAVVAATWTTAGIAVTDGADTSASAASTAATTDAGIATTDAADVAAVVAANWTTAQVASVDAADVVAVVAVNWTTAQVSATDGPDVSATATSVTTGAAMSVTDAPDVAAVVAARWTTAQVSATDARDISATATSVTTGAALSAADGSDTAAVTATIGTVTSAGIAATDAQDTAAVVAANWTTAVLAAIDAADISSVAGSVTTGAVIVGTDGSDSAAAAAANWITAQLAAVDGADSSTSEAAPTVGASIAATDGLDAVSLYLLAFGWQPVDTVPGTPWGAVTAAPGTAWGDVVAAPGTAWGAVTAAPGTAWASVVNTQAPAWTPVDVG